MLRVPPFARPMAMRSVEQTCRERGIARITTEVLAEIRARMGKKPPGRAP